VREEPRQHDVAQPPVPVHPFDAAEEAAADDVVGGAAEDRGDEVVDLLRAVFPVGVAEHDCRRSARSPQRQSDAHRRAQPLVGAERHHLDAPGARQRGGGVGRAVVDHHDVEAPAARRRRHPRQAGLDRRLLVVGGEEEEDGRSGRGNQCGGALGLQHRQAQSPSPARAGRVQRREERHRRANGPGAFTDLVRCP
jgi:hypothetical protein